MDVPPKTSQIWTDIVTGKLSIEFEFLPTRILQGNMARILAKDPTPRNIKKCSSDLWEMFAENMNLPKVQDDLNKIMGQEGSA